MAQMPAPHHSPLAWEFPLAQVPALYHSPPKTGVQGQTHFEMCGSKIRPLVLKLTLQHRLPVWGQMY